MQKIIARLSDAHPKHIKQVVKDLKEQGYEKMQIEKKPFKFKNGTILTHTNIYDIS